MLRAMLDLVNCSFLFPTESKISHLSFITKEDGAHIWKFANEDLKYKISDSENKMTVKSIINGNKNKITLLPETAKKVQDLLKKMWPTMMPFSDEDFTNLDQEVDPKTASNDSFDEPQTALTELLHFLKPMSSAPQGNKE